MHTSHDPLPLKVCWEVKIHKVQSHALATDEEQTSFSFYLQSEFCNYCMDILVSQFQFAKALSRG